ncbi:hypothetical protein N7532_007430 [Penicillium argentinense]|uniref:Uncharacterized protein n=1 Tax=Penicillium argentinense TaxID=1131581 RepID=A0A9W9F7Q2_9EURO|nr:uncharacterized protein N7532_007430 [Penicillium argentinense]KAJ5095139.1 hypothetical protein N7532_007430 [Penicillium argentinense]
MRLLRLQPLLSRGGATISQSHCAYSSLAGLHHQLTARKLPLTYDYLHPQPSHLLNLTLNDLLPPSPTSKNLSTPLPSIRNPSPLPISHHLIYFPPQVTLSQLLPDGTDTLHTPGPPFNRRLWAGGNIRFPGRSPLLDGSRAVCIESIRNVTVKGREGEEKVIVTIERRVGTVPEEESEPETWRRLWTENEAADGEASVVENRDLIFMRAKSAEQIRVDKDGFELPRRIIKSPPNATFRHPILPTKALLFRFSALTFNAHSIHLDKRYTQNEEGYRDCLVHGPLTLTLLLSVLQSYLRGINLQVSKFEYRNLAPLFVGEQLTICGKPKNGDGTWDVWIEGPDGGLAVRGTAWASTLA